MCWLSPIPWFWPHANDCFESWFPPLLFQGRAVEASEPSFLAKPPTLPGRMTKPHQSFRGCSHTPEGGPELHACSPDLRQTLNQRACLQFPGLTLFTAFSVMEAWIWMRTWWRGLVCWTDRHRHHGHRVLLCWLKAYTWASVQFLLWNQSKDGASTQERSKD